MKKNVVALRVVERDEAIEIPELSRSGLIVLTRSTKGSGSHRCRSQRW
jgi:hypothetical protein